MTLEKRNTTIPVFQYQSVYPTWPLMRQIYKINKYGIAIGSKVFWKVDSKRKAKHEPFMATGKVIKMYITTFGSTMRKEAAQIETEGEYLEVFPGRKRTTVSMDKLKLAHQISYNNKS